MKKYLLPIASGIVGIVAMYLIFNEFPLSFSEFKNFNPWVFILWIIIGGLIYLVHSWRWKVIMDSNNIKIGLWRAFLYRVVGKSVSYFTPSAMIGGEPVRALLVKRHGYDFKRSLSTVVLDKLIELASAFIFFFIGVIIILANYVLPKEVQIILLISAVLALFAVVYYYKSVFNKKRVILKIFRFFNLHNIRRLKKYENKVKDFEDLMSKFYIHKTKTFIFSILITSVSWVLMFAEFKLVTMLIGVSLNLGAIFIIFSVVGIAYIVPIPMSLGSLEAGQVGVFELLGIGAIFGLALSLLIRTRDFMWGIFGLAALSILGFNIKRTLEEDTRIDEELAKVK